MLSLQKERMSSHAPLKKLKSLNDLDQAHDEQELAFLKLQVLEQQTMVDELTRVSAELHVLSFACNNNNSFCYAKRPMTRK